MSAPISLFFGLLVAIVVLATLATRLRLPYPILLVLGGLLLGFVPSLPRIELNPELILVLFLPPLIYSSAWLTSWREFRANLRPILQLALGLVLVTTLIIAVVAHVIAGLSWPVAFVLGAVVSPTDAVAASATAKQLGLPRRIVTVIEGESLVNDTSGLVVYRFAVAATLLLVGIGVFLAVLMIGVLRHWRWMFWLVLVAEAGMILDIPATILQLTGILPGLFPVWYRLCRLGASLIAVVIAMWMLQLYRHHGVWARGGKPHPVRTPVMKRHPMPKEADFPHHKRGSTLRFIASC